MGATEGAFNGTDVFINVFDGVDWIPVGGQLSHTETLNTGILDISNKIGVPYYRELLEGEGQQSVDYTVELLYTTQAGYDFVRQLAATKGQALFQVQRGAAPDGVIAIEVILQVQSFSDNSSLNEPFSGSVNLLSSDAFDFNLNEPLTDNRFLTSASEPFKTVGGDQFVVQES
jgi:predicted secreted protein